MSRIVFLADEHHDSDDVAATLEVVELEERQELPEAMNVTEAVRYIMNRVESLAGDGHNSDDPDAVIVRLRAGGHVITVRRRDLDDPETAPCEALSLVPGGGQR